MDGYLRELPGGSGPGTPLEQAVTEVREETGLDLAPGRLRAHGSRHVVGALATHHAYPFSAELAQNGGGSRRPVRASSLARNTVGWSAR